MGPQTMNPWSRRAVPLAVVAALLAGVIFTIISGSNARADYYTGCGYGYASDGSTFGYGTGYGYGFFGGLQYGYGNTICRVQVSTGSVTSATQYQSYTFQLAGIGGMAPYRWSFASGSLPSGLQVTSSGSITGTPSAAGTFTFTVTMTDANGYTATSTQLSLTVNPAVVAGGGGGGGGATTTTTAPTTTTTAPRPASVTCDHINGQIFVGRVSHIAIVGKGFHGQPTITSTESHTRFGVNHDSGTVLHVTVVVSTDRGRGNMHRMTIVNPDGGSCTLAYRQH